MAVTSSRLVAGRANPSVTGSNVTESVRSRRNRRRWCQLLEAFERPITITRLPHGQVRGLASLRTVVEPSRKRTVIS